MGPTSGATVETFIVVPCFNEARRLDIPQFVTFAEAHPDISFVFVDDGSTDETPRLVAGVHALNAQLNGLCLTANGGKAAAVRAGILYALERQPAAVGFWDADLATPLDVIPLMLDLMRERPDILFVLGSRVLLLGRTIRRRSIRHYLGRIFSTAVSLVTRIEVYDSQCGAKILRGGAFAQAMFAEPFVTRWLFDLEILLRMRNDRHSLAGAFEFVLPRWIDVDGSKVKQRDFLRAAIELMRLRRVYIAGQDDR